MTINFILPTVIRQFHVWQIVIALSFLFQGLTSFTSMSRSITLQRRRWWRRCRWRCRHRQSNRRLASAPLSQKI